MDLGPPDGRFADICFENFLKSAGFGGVPMGATEWKRAQAECRCEDWK